MEISLSKTMRGSSAWRRRVISYHCEALRIRTGPKEISLAHFLKRTARHSLEPSVHGILGTVSTFINKCFLCGYEIERLSADVTKQQLSLSC